MTRSCADHPSWVKDAARISAVRADVMQAVGTGVEERVMAAQTRPRRHRDRGVLCWHGIDLGS